MSLEGFFLTVGSNVLSSIIGQAIANKWNRLNEAKVKQIIEDYLKEYPTAGHASVIEREIIIILGSGGLLSPRGELRLPASRELPALPEKLLRDWWDGRVYKIISVLSERALSVLDW